MAGAVPPVSAPRAGPIRAPIYAETLDPGGSKHEH